ncbi:uncharacterized protein LOC135391802 isoform X2 [Ornithodoros turicata]|uniref:uncharacterized protein LOC135391802 isoform X2 n=1 Tax=Ornithodoros turicata TaxID=34597 RepID=UPI0031391339
MGSAGWTGILPRAVHVSVSVIADGSFDELFQSESLAMEFIETALNGATLKYASGFRHAFIRLIPGQTSGIGPGSESTFMKLRSDGNIDSEESLRIFARYAAHTHSLEEAKLQAKAVTKDVLLLVTARKICKSGKEDGYCEVVKGSAVPRSLCTGKSAAIVTLNRDIQEATDRIATYIAKVMGAGVRETHGCTSEVDGIFNDLAEEDMIAYFHYFLTPGSRFHEDSFCRSKSSARPGIKFCGNDTQINLCLVHCCSPGDLLSAVYPAPDGTACDWLRHEATLSGSATWTNSFSFLEAKRCYRGTCSARASDLQGILRTQQKDFPSRSPGHIGFS